MGVNGTSIVADATENIRNNVRVQTMSEIFDTEGYVVWMISDGKLRRMAASRMDQSVFKKVDQNLFNQNCVYWNQ